MVKSSKQSASACCVRYQGQVASLGGGWGPQQTDVFICMRVSAGDSGTCAAVLSLVVPLLLVHLQRAAYLFDYIF